jgi:hypothetical protein
MKPVLIACAATAEAESCAVSGAVWDHDRQYRERMKRALRSLARLACLGALLMLGACAFGDRKVTLAYQPQAEAPPASATPAGTGAPANVMLVLLPFKDERPSKKIVGEVRNGWGMHTADVVAENDVAAWLTDGLRLELQKAGYRIVDETEAGPDAVRFEGTVARVFCTALFSYEAEVSFFAVVKKSGEAVIDRQYHGTGTAGVNMAATSGSYKESLNEALRSALRSLLADLRIATGPPPTT